MKPRVVPATDRPDSPPDEIIPCSIVHTSGGARAVPEHAFDLQPGDQAHFIFDMTPYGPKHAEVWLYRAGWAKRNWTKLKAIMRRTGT